MAILVDPVRRRDQVGRRDRRSRSSCAARRRQVRCRAASIDDACKQAIRDCIPLGPLHNPANLMGIEACEKAMPGKPQVAVFDTAFHMTMPPKAYRYAIPTKWYTEEHLRRYGFHGTSHRFVSKRCIELMGGVENAQAASSSATSATVLPCPPSRTASARIPRWVFPLLPASPWAPARATSTPASRSIIMNQ